MVLALLVTNFACFRRPTESATGEAFFFFTVQDKDFLRVNLN